MPTVTFHHGDQVKKITAPEGQTILQIALDHALPMEHACGGNGFCTTCMCSVRKGMENLTPRNDREENMGITSDPYRLGCQARAKGEVEIQILE